jgi:hypothetical protein
MKLFRWLFLLLSTLSLAQKPVLQNPVLLTRGSREALHARLKIHSREASVSAATVGQTQIGTFSAVIFPRSVVPPNGMGFYEFDWDSSLPPYPWFSRHLSFSNTCVYVKGTKLCSGPYDEDPYFGIAFITTDPRLLDTCQRDCIDIALQLIFPENPYTFEEVDAEGNLTGSFFTTYAINNTFITPPLGQAEITSQCGQNGFCSVNVVPVMISEFH